MAEPTLDASHSYREWEEGDGTCRCTLTVEMPSGGTRTFGGSGASATRARFVAAFAAKCEIFKEEQISSDESDDSEGSTSNNSDDTDTVQVTSPNHIVDGAGRSIESDSGLEEVFDVAEDVVQFERTEVTTEVVADFVESRDAGSGSIDEVLKNESRRMGAFEPIVASSVVPSSADEDDTFDEEVPLAIVKSQALEAVQTHRAESLVNIETSEGSPIGQGPDSQSNSTQRRNRSETVDPITTCPTPTRALTKPLPLRTETFRSAHSAHAVPAKPLKSSKALSPKRHAVAPPSQSRTPSSPNFVASRLQLQEPPPLSVSDSDSAIPDTPPTPFCRKRPAQELQSASEHFDMGSGSQMPHRWMQPRVKRHKSEHHWRRRSSNEHRNSAAWNSVPQMPKASTGQSIPVPIMRVHSSSTPSASNSAALQSVQLPLPIAQRRHLDAAVASRPVPFGHVGPVPPNMPNHSINPMAPLHGVPMPPLGMPHASIQPMPYDPRYTPSPMIPQPMYMPPMPVTGAAPYPPPGMPGHMAPGMQPGYPYAAPPHHMPNGMPYQYVRPRGHNDMRSASVRHSEKMQVLAAVRQKALHDASKDANLCENMGLPGQPSAVTQPAQNRRSSTPEVVTPRRHRGHPGLGSQHGHTRKSNSSHRKTGQPGETRASISSLEASTDGDEDDGEDHVSILNLAAQKSRLIKDIRYSSGRSILHHSGSQLWQIEVSAKNLVENATSNVLTKVAVGRTRKLAKQKAAKNLLLALKSIAPDKKELEGFQKAIPKPATPTTEKGEKGSGAVSYVGALNQLWHWKVLEHAPDFVFKPADDTEGAQWQCTVLLSVVGRDKIVLKATAANKRRAKGTVAQMAFERLKQDKVPRIEVFNNMNELKPARCEEENEKPIEEDVEAVKNAVQMSEDEDDKEMAYDGKDIDFGGRLVLPKGYTLVVARSPKQCEDWFKAHAKPGTDIGVFVDSWSARSAFGDIDAIVPETGGEDVNLPKPLFCFSSKSSGLLVQADNCTPDERIGEPYVLDGFWMPKAAEVTLKDSRVRKHGHLLDDGVMRLWSLHGFRAQAVHDVAATAYGITGMRSTGRNRILWSLGELTKHWLHKEFIGANAKEVWANVDGAPEQIVEAKNPDVEVLATGVLSAYASICIQEQVDFTAKKKRAELYGPAAEFLDLSRRLMQNPFRQ